MHRHSVGNDIIDLGEPAILLHHRWERFIDRVCTPGERRALNRAQEPKLYLWSLFAAKEAAFKLVVKRLGPVPFAHRSFVVRDDLHAVDYRGASYPLRIDVGSGWVHALAGTGAPVAFRVRQRSGAQSSQAARQLLGELAAPILGCEPASLCVARAYAPEYWDALAPPVLLRSGKPARLDISLSHDGPFVAAALVRPSDRE